MGKSYLWLYYSLEGFAFTVLLLLTTIIHGAYVMLICGAILVLNNTGHI